MSFTPVRTEPLSPKELYLFDTTGHRKNEGFLSPETAEPARIAQSRFPMVSRAESFSACPALTKENFPSLDNTPAGAGAAILLNEALSHGTLPKSTERERLLLAFSYAPAFVADWAEIGIGSEDISKAGHY
ncbi:hypothetical protein [Streptomyces sp. NPDC018045]|uniref:hypothetical protein n=1 Tax=Streptomyces sp. NPDC018045 TaxID=3365037 RepID=UPI00379D32D7